MLKLHASRLKVVVLPTHQSYAFYPLFLQPRNQVEKSLLIFSLIFRKWRFQISDLLSIPWHYMGQVSFKNHFKPGIRLYHWGNSITTRNAGDEYFFKFIHPVNTQQVEFIFPSSCTKDSVKKQLNAWISG